MGTSSALAAPHNHYLTKDDRWVAIACTNDRIFGRLANLMGQSELTSDQRFSSERSRVANRQAIDEIVERWTKSIDESSLTQTLRGAEIPSSPIYSIADIFDDPQYAARGTLAKFTHPRLGEVVMPSVVPRLSGTPGGIEWLGRDLGADTDDLLSRALGYSRARVDDLRRRGVV
jgi:crotonobetainyl-CoA:carnitine CoA-transferase CaiB-like acyl-CoA transferase